MRATTAPAFRTLESLTFRIGRLLAHYAVYEAKGLKRPVPARAGAEPAGEAEEGAEA